jgi:hypothetical protein
MKKHLLLKTLFFTTALLTIAAEADETKKLSCSPDRYNQQKIPAALVDAEIVFADKTDKDLRQRAIAEMQSLMIVAKDGGRENADRDFKNSFWGEVTDDAKGIHLEPNDDPHGIKSRIARLEISTDPSSPEKSFVQLKNKKIYYMDCSIH